MNLHPGKLHTAFTAADMLTARETPVLVGRYGPDDWRGNAFAIEFLTKDDLYGRLIVPREGGVQVKPNSPGVIVSISPVLAFLAKHPAVAPVTPIKVKLDGADLHFDADGDTMWFTGQPPRPQHALREPSLPQAPVASYEGSPSELVANGLPLDLLPAWGDRIPVGAFAVQQAIGLLQPDAVATAIYTRRNGKAVATFAGRRDGLTFWFALPLRDVEAAR